MPKKLTVDIELTGDQKYKQALKELNSGNAVLRSEMVKLQAEYKNNANSVEFLNKKGDLLQRQLQQQQDKVSKLREAVAYAAKEYGEASEKTQDYIQKLNYAEAAEFNLQHAIDENNEAIQNQGKAMTGFGDAIDGVASKLGIQIPQGAKEALNGMNKLSTGTVAAMGAAAAGVAAVIKGIKDLQKTTLEAAARADEIMSQANQMNISAQQYQSLQYASPFVDVDVSTMASSLSKLTKLMGEAASGSESARAKFADLRVEFQNDDETLRNSYDVWLDTMDALAGITNETERDVAAQELLGKSASELANIYREGTDALRGYIEAAQDNYVLSDEQLEQLGAVDDAWQQLQLSIEHNKDMIAVQWAPAAKSALESFNKFVTAAGKALVDSGLIQGFGELFKIAASLLDPIANLLSTADGAPSRLQPVYEVLHGIAGVFALIADAADTVVGILEGINIFGSKESRQAGWHKVGVAQGYGRESGEFSHMQQWMGYSTDGYYYDESIGAWTGNYGRNAGGTKNWRGGLTWVGEAGPELVSLPRGSQIMNAQDSRSMGGDTFYVTIDAKNVKEFNDIVKMVQSERIRNRMG